MLIFTIWSTGLFAQPFYIAHRGASYLAPENTVASAMLAWELGADAVEIDIYLSSDNKVMVIHDKDTKRICKGEENRIIKSTSSVDSKAKKFLFFLKVLKLLRRAKLGLLRSNAEVKLYLL